MSWDLFGNEEHFVSHLAPIYHAAGREGTFYVNSDLFDHARSLGIEPEKPMGNVDRPILVASYGDLKRARAAGRSRVALIEHGYGQTYSNDHPSYAGGRHRQDVSLFLCPNEQTAQRNRAANPGASVEVVGCPKLDDLPAREGTGLTLAISFHWNPGMGVPEATGTAPYYRTVLPTLAKGYHILGHAHPKAFRNGHLERYYAKASIEVVRDFRDICRRADLYICDNSSTIYEFAATGRPVVVLNGPHYRRHVEHGFRFWEAASVGVQVDHPRKLAAAIEYALTDPPEQQRLRETALDLVYRYRSGAAKRAVTALRRWQVPQVLAA